MAGPNRIEMQLATQMYLGGATGYDGNPMMQSKYSDSTSLTNVASTIRNTIGSPGGAQVGATQLAGHRGPNVYVRKSVVRNVLYTTDSTTPTTRAYVPGADPVFTADLSSGTAQYTTTYDPSAPPGAAASTLNVFTDIHDLSKNVVHGAESVAKMAWRFTDNAVETIIHTAESVYQLTIHTLEDAVTAVVGFLKSVVAELAKVIEWLSALFNWKNILANHGYLKRALTNPTDPANPGITGVLGTWISKQLNGGTDLTTVFGTISGNGATSMTSSSQAAAGQTVGSNSSGGGNDPNTVYNTGGNNNANQCTWMSQKTSENAAGGSTATPSQAAAVAVGYDPHAIGAAISEFFIALEHTLATSFASLPGDIRTQMGKALDTFKDPKTVLSSGVSDIMVLMHDIADDLIEFAESFAKDTLTLLDSLLSQMIGFLANPIKIPFVSELYKLISGNDLSLLDLVCLIAAVPATLLLDVITGSPQVPSVNAATRAGAQVGGTPGAEAGFILMGLAGFAVGQFACAWDIVCMDFRESVPGWATKPPEQFQLPAFFGWLDLAVDFISWGCFAGAGLGITESKGGSWQAQDYVFQGIGLAPQLINLGLTIGGQFDPELDTSGEFQAIRDMTFGAGNAVMAGVYAHFWPSDYLNAPKAKGLSLSANIFAATQGVSEVLFVLLSPWDWAPVQFAVKYLLYTVGNVLSLTGEILSAAD